MQEASNKKKMEKDQRLRQEIEDDRKIHAQLDQMREAFRKEENPGDFSRASESANGVSRNDPDRDNSGPRGILKSREQVDQPQPEFFAPPVQQI